MLSIAVLWMEFILVLCVCAGAYAVGIDTYCHDWNVLIYNLKMEENKNKTKRRSRYGVVCAACIWHIASVGIALCLHTSKIHIKISSALWPQQWSYDVEVVVDVIVLLVIVMSVTCKYRLQCIILCVHIDGSKG